MSRNFSVTTLVALLSAGVLVAGCGGSPGPTAAAKESPSPTPAAKQKLIGKAEACALVTADDASAAVGTTMTSLAGGASFQGLCIYGSSDGTTTVTVFAQVYPDNVSANAVTAEQMAVYLGASGVGTAKVVNGIGDKAVEYSSTQGSGGLLIMVFKSNVVFMISMMPSNATAVELMAKTAAGRLKPT